MCCKKVEKMLFLKFEISDTVLMSPYSFLPSLKSDTPTLFLLIKVANPT